ncbi:MAG: DUF547 domain-containing protein, partial [Planctomycetes bacterium]|nr:DUF547 domain-containing protein [Planctomycetota bacterium]
TGAAVAFLIARYLARERVRRYLERSPRLAAVDEAIGQKGWKIVALLRLSPAVPFNLQNYLYGVTAVRFWPYVLASWIAMLPGTFLYVYLGSLGAAAAQEGPGASAGQWAMRIVGLLATVAVTVYITRLAQRAIREKTAIEEKPPESEGPAPSPEAPRSAETAGWPWGALAAAAAAVVVLTLAVWAQARQDTVREAIAGMLGLPPMVKSEEKYEPKSHGPTFDHSTFEQLVKKHVDPDGWVDYEGLQGDAAQLDRYLAELADAPFEDLGRDEKLALLINAYNAFTLRLILDHYPLESIKDIPEPKRWEAERWKVGPHTWTLNQIEHEQIRPNFREPRIHFALVCAAVGCPPLRQDAYTGERLEEQLAEQTEYVHTHPRWLRFDAERNVVHLTELYQWYGTDFEQYAPSVLDYAARYAPELKKALDSPVPPRIEWIKYDWALNSPENKPARNAASDD